MTFLNAFFSFSSIYPSNQVNVIKEKDIKRAQALCVILNSSLFFSQFFLLKEESTGRYIDIRFYDLAEMYLSPSDKYIEPLRKVFLKFADKKFPALRNQFDKNFEQRYRAFWAKERGNTQSEFISRILDKPINPSSIRIDFDYEVCQTLDIPVTKEELMQIYEAFTYEMIIIRGLKRD